MWRVVFSYFSLFHLSHRGPALRCSNPEGSQSAPEESPLVASRRVERASERTGRTSKVRWLIRGLITGEKGRLDEIQRNANTESIKKQVLGSFGPQRIRRYGTNGRQLGSSRRPRFTRTAFGRTIDRSTSRSDCLKIGHSSTHGLFYATQENRKSASAISSLQYVGSCI